MNSQNTTIQKVLEQIGQVILGKERETEEIMMAFLADGHVLLEDIPGVGKTTMAMAFVPYHAAGLPEGTVYAGCASLGSDGIFRLPAGSGKLLEVMEERKVTVDGVTRPVPSPFLVIATQNPSGTAGTQSRCRRRRWTGFMISLSLGYPDFESELSMAKSIGEEDRLSVLTPAAFRPGTESPSGGGLPGVHQRGTVPVSSETGDGHQRASLYPPGRQPPGHHRAGEDGPGLAPGSRAGIM